MYSGRRAAAATAPANGSAAASTTTRGGARGGTSAASAGSNNNSQQQQFQPKLIASQIVALQCLHYFVWTVFLQINAVLYGNSLTIDRIFTDDYVRLWQWQGWPDALAILLSAVVGYVRRLYLLFYSVIVVTS
jgi:Integral membrane protein S linking to the trans Golgi network